MTATKSRNPRTLCLCLALSFLATCANARVQSDVLAAGVHGQLVLPVIAPESGASSPAVILIHGREGLRHIYLDEARGLSVHGYVVLVLDTYAGARWGGFTRAERARRWAVWEDEIAAAARFLASRPDVDAQRIALVGMSQGAALALTSSEKIPGLRAIVDYYGPDPESWYVSTFMGQRRNAGNSLLTTMPPLLILHGRLDAVVPVGNSRRLEAQLRARGRDVELHVYPYAMHSLNHPRSLWSWPVATADDAHARVLRFLDTHLGLAAESMPRSTDTAIENRVE